MILKSEPIELEVKALTEEGEFEGYGSVFGNVDSWNDVVAKGAFSETLKKVPPKKVKMLYQHSSYDVIGTWQEMKEDTKGLWVKGKLLMNLAKGKEVYELIKAEAVDGLSIGYRTKEYEYDTETNIRTLTKLDLREVSVVTFPANDKTNISKVKAEDGSLPLIRDFERFLRDAGFSSKEAKAVIADGYKHLLSERDAGESANLAEDINKATERILSCLRN